MTVKCRDALRLAAQHQSSLSELERLVPQATVTVTVTVIPRQSAPGGNVTRTSRHVWFRDDSHGNHSEFTEILMNIQQRRLGRRNGSLAGCRVPVSGPGGGRAQVQDSLQMKNSSRLRLKTVAYVLIWLMT